MSSTNAPNSFVRTYIAPKGVTCLCGRPECSGFSNSFKILRDDRKRYVKLPPYNSNGDNSQRTSYLRHLLPSHSVEEPTSSEYIALHHFHPTILKEAHTHTKSIPLLLSPGKAVQLRMNISEQDRVSDENGMPMFIYSPNYPLSRVKQDLVRIASMSKRQDKQQVRKEKTTTTTMTDTVADKVSGVEKKVTDNTSTAKKETIDTCIPEFVTMDCSGDDDSDVSSLPDHDAIHEHYHVLTNRDPVDEKTYLKEENEPKRKVLIDLDDLREDGEFYNAHDEIAAEQSNEERLQSIHKKSIQVQVMLKELLGTLGDAEKDNHSRIEDLVDKIMEAVCEIETAIASPSD